MLALVIGALLAVAGIALLLEGVLILGILLLIAAVVVGPSGRGAGRGERRTA